MDIDDEMMVHMLMEEEANVAAEYEHFMILAGLLQLVEDEKARPKHRGLKCKRKNSKAMQRMKGHVILNTNYFAVNFTYTPKDFHWRFRMNKKLFKTILHGVREFDAYLMKNKDVVGLPGLSSI
jgi:hypothetical protein